MTGFLRDWEPPGATVEAFFHTFDSNDPSASTTVTTLAVGDIKIYKDGGGTERASTSGFTVDDDFDTLTGIHRISIDLSDNTTANFYEAGSVYTVVVDSITVDAATVRFVLGAFRIGYEAATVNTTIATLASQTSFTLEDGSADNDAYNGWTAVIHDLASAVQLCAGLVSDYVGSTKTITLSADPGIFTMAAGDNVSLFPPVGVHGWNAVALATTNPLPNAAADAAGGLPISDAGGLDLDTKLAATNEVTAARMSELDAATVGKMANQVDEIRTDTAEIGAAGAGLTEAGGTGDHLTAVPWNSTWDAEVQSECNDALVAIHLDHLFAVDYDPASKPGTSTALLNELVESDSGVSRFTVNALENAPSGSGASAEAIADAVWDEAKAGHVASGSFGEEIQDHALSSEISALNNISAADVWAAGSRTLTAGTNIVLAKGTGVTGFNDPSVSDILTTQMTEAYAADGVAPTLAQALFQIMQQAGEFSISGTTITVKQLDGSSTAMTFTLNDSSNPTSRTRAT